MFILTGNKWRGGFLDYECPEDSLRIDVDAWANVCPVVGAYFVRCRSLRVIVEYFREIGVGPTVRKILSRFRERSRNDKYYSIGLGRVSPDQDGKRISAGTAVAFIAPLYPRCVERVVLPEILIREIPHDLHAMNCDRTGIRYVHLAPKELVSNELLGWHAQSGRTVNPAVIESAMKRIETYWQKPSETFETLPLNQRSPVKVSSWSREGREHPGRLSAVVFGLGNYAKTQIIPNLDRRIQVDAIHEIDPTQIGNPASYSCAVSTCVHPDPERKCDVYFVAGYHHTHAQLAIDAVKTGATAVVEKPVVVTYDEMHELIRVLRKGRGRLFSCYHMRYNHLFELARRDLGSTNGNAVHVTADVYEVALPRFHWYRWPNSKSHIVSNGCHWLDHFLFMNAYFKPIRHTIKRSRNGDSYTNVELENGACLFLHLTHLGSPRIGVQDHVVMRAGDSTITVTNGAQYQFEDTDHVKRRKRVNRMHAYKRMYREITRKIVSGSPGDSTESIVVMNSLMLTLDEELRRQDVMSRMRSVEVGPIEKAVVGHQESW